MLQDIKHLSMGLDNFILENVELKEKFNIDIKAPFSSRNFLTLSKIQNMKIFNVF